MNLEVGIIGLLNFLVPTTDPV